MTMEDDTMQHIQELQETIKDTREGHKYQKKQNNQKP